MPQFTVQLRGTGIDLPSGGDPIVGLIAQRKVRAATSDEAFDKARTQLTQEWQEGKFQQRNRGAAPVFAIETMVRLPWWKAPFTKAPKRGFDFYSLTKETGPAKEL